MSAPTLPWTEAALLTVAEMAAADRAAIAGGVPGIDLMETAGGAVAQRTAAAFAGRRIAVLCGPGNNGGDGYVAARRLAEAGIDVEVYAFGNPAALRGDAAIAAGRWTGPVAALDEAAVGALLAGDRAIVDALFGAGLSRPLEGPAARAAAAIAAADVPVLAVDVPSGIMGDSGAADGAAFRAVETVTFCRRKPGHFLLPGADMTGRVTVADIGISDAVVAQQGPRTWVNSAEVWYPDLPRPRPEDHKYARGHVCIWGGGEMPGAAHLAAAGARRAGAGMVSILTEPAVAPLFRAGAPGVLVREIPDLAAYQGFIGAKNRQVLLVGPGNGTGADTRDRALAALAVAGPPEGGGAKSVVLDADAISAFAEEPERLISALHDRAVLTPHGGEFARLFGPAADRLSAARQAAARTGATIVLKGFDTIIARPDGAAVINANGVPDLASAGTGDVLAGILAGLLAQGMAPFPAAAAAVWLHGAAAARAGRGLIAEDLPAVLPSVLAALDRHFPEMEAGYRFRADADV